MNLYFTQPDHYGRSVPFLLDASMRPVTSVNAWLREVARNGSTPSPNTWRAYAYNVLDFFNYLEEHNLDWRKVTVNNLYDYRDVQALHRSSHTKDFLNRKTINARLRDVHKFYCFALEHDEIKEVPFKYKQVKTTKPVDAQLLSHIKINQESERPSVFFERLPKSSIKWQSHESVLKWLNTIPVWRDKLICKLAYETGMRRAEVTNLEINGLPELDSVDQSRPEVCFTIRGKGGKKRMVYVSIREFIEIHDYIRLERAKIMKGAAVKHDRVFVNRDGSPLQPEAFNRICKSISERCQIKISPHTLRHSFSVRCLKFWRKVGVSQPEKLLQARLGHSSVVTTQIYIHLTDELEIEEAIGNAKLIETITNGVGPNEK